MNRTVMLFFRRNIRLYGKIFLLSLLFMGITGSFSIVAGYFEKAELVSSINASPVDYELQAPLVHTYSISNLTLLLQYVPDWEAYRSWQKYISGDGLILILDPAQTQNFRIGIQLEENRKNLILGELKKEYNSFDLLGGRFNSSFFMPVNTLPFDLDLLISKDLLFQLVNSSIQLNSPSLAYYLNFESDEIVSPKVFSEKCKSIMDGFRTFFFKRKVILNSITEYQVAIVNFFHKPFSLLLILISLLTIVASVWMIEIIANYYVDNVTPLIKILATRGLKSKEQKIILKIVPIIVDTFALLSYIIITTSILVLFKFQAILAYFIAMITYFFLIIKRYSCANIQTKNENNASWKYILALIFLVGTGIIIQRTIARIIPMWINSLLNIGYVILFYYVFTLIAAESTIYLLTKFAQRNFGLFQLFCKSLKCNKAKLRSWVHALLLLSWVLMIIVASTQSFLGTYENEYNMENPSSLVINTSISLEKLRDLNFSAEIVESIFPIAHEVANYLIYYDLYFMNFSLLSGLYQDYVHKAHITNLDESCIYMDSDMSKTLEIGDDELFPIGMGDMNNKSYVFRRVKTVEYFPLIKPLEERPFVVASFDPTFANVTLIQQIIIKFKPNVDIYDGIIYLKQILGSNITCKYSAPKIHYKTIISLYVALTSCFVVTVILLSQLTLIKDTWASYWLKFHQRGMSKRKIRNMTLKIIIVTVFASLLVALLASFSYTLIYMRTALYPIRLYLPPAIITKATIFSKLLVVTSIMTFSCLLPYITKLKKDLRVLSPDVDSEKAILIFESS